MQMTINSERDIRINIAENILEANGDIVALSDAIFSSPTGQHSTIHSIAMAMTKNQLTTTLPHFDI